jgi:hypothetical protein
VRFVSALFTGLVSFGAQAAEEAPKPCPSATDMGYRVKDDDTLSQVTARAYCVSGEPDVGNAWRAVAQYNRIPIGPNPHKIFTLTSICLPERIGDVSWSAARCIAPETGSAAASGPASCGNGKREGKEVCDGQDLGGMSCETVGLPPGRLACRADCAAFDSAACLPPEKPPCPACPAPPQKEEPKACAEPPEKPSEPLLRRVAADALVGLSVPLTGATRSNIYSVVFTAAIDVRLTLGWLEITPRAILVLGAHDIVFNDIDQPQTVLGGGGSIGLGLPIESGSFILTPGIEGGALYIARTIDRMDYPFVGQVEEQSGGIPFAGVFFRPEYTFGKARGLALSLDLSIDLILASLAGNRVYENFNAKVLGGVGYAF